MIGDVARWLTFDRAPQASTLLDTGALRTVGSKHAGHDTPPWSRRVEGEALGVRRKPKHGEPHHRLDELLARRRTWGDG